MTIEDTRTLRRLIALARDGEVRLRLGVAVAGDSHWFFENKARAEFKADGLSFAAVVTTLYDDMTTASLCSLCLDHGTVQDHKGGKHKCPTCKGGVPMGEDSADEVPF